MCTTAKGCCIPIATPCPGCEVPHHVAPGAGEVVVVEAALPFGDGGVQERWVWPFLPWVRGPAWERTGQVKGCPAGFEQGSRSKPSLALAVPSAWNDCPSSRDPLLVTDHPTPSKGPHEGTNEWKDGDSSGRYTINCMGTRERPKFTDVRRLPVAGAGGRRRSVGRRVSPAQASSIL